MTSKIVAICNQKGGVGKTTTTFHLARAAVAEGRRTLLIDADPQGNLSSVTVPDLERDQPGLADVLTDRSSDGLADITVPGAWEGLSVAPSTGSGLAAVRDELVIAGAGRESRLRNALDAVSDSYDLVLIDCAPALDQITVNALTASHGAAVVTEASLFSTDGLAQLIRTIATVRQHYNPTLNIAGIIVNRYDAREKGVRAAMDELTEGAAAHGLSLLEPHIPKRAAIRDAIESGTGLDQARSAEARALANIYTAHLHSIEGALK